MTVIIGIDPHKATHMAVVIDGDEQAIARLELMADRAQTQRLLAWAAPLGDQRTWVIESADGLGKLLSQELLAAGEHVVDVPPTLAARVRLLGPVKAAKNDGNDALSIAIAGLRHCGLRAVRSDDHSTVLRLLVGRYDDLVSLRTQAVCRLHAVLRELVAGVHHIVCRLIGRRNCSGMCIPRVWWRVNASASLASCSPMCARREVEKRREKELQARRRRSVARSGDHVVAIGRASNGLNPPAREGVMGSNPSPGTLCTVHD